MENWEQLLHLSGGRCYQMYFTEFNETIRFKVVGLDSSGARTAINCATGIKFGFNRNELTKTEYVTLVEIDCDICSP